MKTLQKLSLASLFLLAFSSTAPAVDVREHVYVQDPSDPSGKLGRLIDTFPLDFSFSGAATDGDAFFAFDPVVAPLGPGTAGLVRSGSDAAGTEHTVSVLGRFVDPRPDTRWLVAARGRQALGDRITPVHA